MAFLTQQTKKTWTFNSIALFLVFTGWLAEMQAISISSPIEIILNQEHHYSLLNSVAFHPKKNVFCVTYTQNNKVVFYEIDEDQQLLVLQTLQNPWSKFSHPDFADFSRDGRKLIVVNWTDETFGIYPIERDGRVHYIPTAKIAVPSEFKDYKPHGMAVSQSANYLAVAYGCVVDSPRAIVLFELIGNELRCVSRLKGDAFLGIPKGIAFSPDGLKVIVSFSDRNSLSIFNIEKGVINPIPRQIIQGETTGLSRPEDIKITPDGKYCVATNSGNDTVTFYAYDAGVNLITEKTPSFTLQNPDAMFSCPHGIAFSPDGNYMVVTQFGPREFAEDEGVIFERNMESNEGRINLYSLTK